MTDQKLIEDTAKAIMEASHGEGEWEFREPIEEELYLRRARAALAVFEKAHTPTDDEREGLVESYSGWNADEVARNPRVAADVIERLRSRLLDEFRRSEVPEPSADGFCTCNGSNSGGRMRDCGISAHRAEAFAQRGQSEPQASEPAECGTTPDEWLDHAEGYPCKLPKGHSGDHETDAMTWAEPQGEPSDAHLRGRWSNGDPVHVITNGVDRRVAPNHNEANWIPEDES